MRDIHPVDRTCGKRSLLAVGNAVEQILEQVHLAASEVVGSLPVQPTRGSTMNVRLACFTFSFFEELLATGTEHG